MAIRLGRFEMPKSLVKDESTATDTYAKFIAEPFEAGYGHTVGNSLRRVLLSSLEGAAITAVKIQDSPQCEVLNKDQIICTVDKKQKFEAELEVKVGRGFATGDENKHPDQPIGIIAIDSIFSPVTRVKYAVGNTRVGQRTDYDKLELEIWTDGRISPEEALVQSSSILKRHFEPFYGYDENAVAFDETPQLQNQENQKLKKLLAMSVNEIELSVRAANCLNNANITSVGQLAQKSESEMLKYRNFGKKSLNEIKEKLTQLGLSLGMKFESGLVDSLAISSHSHDGSL